MSNKEAFFVVIGINKPTCNAISAVTYYFSSLRLENVDTINFYTDSPIRFIQNCDVGFTENDEEITLTVVLQAHHFEQLVFHALAEDYIGESKAAEMLNMPLTQFHRIRQMDTTGARQSFWPVQRQT